MVTKHTRLCEKHFEKKFIYRPPGGTISRLLEGATPVLHPWNNFGRDSPVATRRSPRKRSLTEVNAPSFFASDGCSVENNDDSQMQMDTEVIHESCQSDSEKAAEINHLSRQVTE